MKNTAILQIQSMFMMGTCWNTIWTLGPLLRSSKRFGPRSLQGVKNEKSFPCRKDKIRQKLRKWDVLKRNKGREKALKYQKNIKYRQI